MNGLGLFDVCNLLTVLYNTVTIEHIFIQIYIFFCIPFILIFLFSELTFEPPCLQYYRQYAFGFISHFLHV